MVAHGLRSITRDGHPHIAILGHVASTYKQSAFARLFV
jgi:hypothetical protein